MVSRCRVVQAKEHPEENYENNILKMEHCLTLDAPGADQTGL